MRTKVRRETNRMHLTGTGKQRSHKHREDNQNPREIREASSSQVPKRRKATRRESTETQYYLPWQGEDVMDVDSLIPGAASAEPGNLEEVLAGFWCDGLCGQTSL